MFNMYYKSPDKSLHFLSESDIAAGGEYLLPKDSISITEAQYKSALAEKNKPTPEQLKPQIIGAIQKRLDDFASTRGYDNILSACTYATSSVARFKTEGQACVNLRDATWDAAYKVMNEVEAGKLPMPSSITDIESKLPALAWPA